MIRIPRNGKVVSCSVVVVVLLCVCLPARGDDPEPTASRHIALEGQPNFRDIGGYKTSDGKTVKSGQVYRSGELPRLTDDDVSKLRELGIKTVVNFLTDVEIEARGRDRLPNGVKEISLPIKVGDDLAKLGLEARQSGDFSKMPPEINPKVHEVLTVEATAEYAAFLREVAKPENRPLVFHCSHGVHRTGTGTAILLWTLGVPSSRSTKLGLDEVGTVTIPTHRHSMLRIHTRRGRNAR